ncbi:uncharacterized protein Triagg1_6047 [Trichoderma aggressivum f. europaeum]|uniref:Methyltransferase SirN-like protein n=1 Tax=Trichoderma aggressivum f. europaeum TaxID=173218 RepID=A0AAE1IC17_9HYPO|nr:hypothetical protein Triagg1_6047 [Trichoderma aggressivum f. europaeum]
MSDSKKPTPDPRYPDIRHVAEARRLQSQGALIIDALGGIILCPLDTSRKDLRILDSATADGHLLTLIRNQLAHPESAELIGTDIADFPPLDLPENITLGKQDILKPWPEKWEAHFDFVHQRTGLAITGGMERAVETVRRYIDLLKPGGWIQLVDGTLIDEPMAEDDKAWVKMMKVLKQCVALVGLDTTLGVSTADILKNAGEGLLRNIGEKQGVSPLGKGAASQELEELGYVELKGMHSGCVTMLKEMPKDKRPMAPEQVEGLLPEVLREAQAGECEMRWYAAWGQKI